MPPENSDKTWYSDFYKKSQNDNLIIPPVFRDRYRRLPHPELHRLEMWHRLIGQVVGKKILFVGCGIEPSPVFLALQGGDVWVLDLAKDAMTRQIDLALANGTIENTHFLVASCDRLPLADGEFDLLVGIEILHHLQERMDKACIELARVLKTDGFAVFEEPIALSATLRRVRSFLPIPRLPDASPLCRPLDEASMACLDRYFSQQICYFTCLARFDRFIFDDQPTEFAPRWKYWISLSLHLTDYLLLSIPRVRRRIAGAMAIRLTPLRQDKTQIVETAHQASNVRS